MNSSKEIAAPTPAGVGAAPVAPPRGQRIGIVAAAIVLAVLFGRALFDLFAFAATSTLYSHILLIPVISAYLVWKRRMHAPPATRSAALGAITAAAGVGLLLLESTARSRGETVAIEDSLALTTSGFVAAAWGFTLWFFGRRVFRFALFPLLFLTFMIPIPTTVLAGIDLFLQHGSAAVADALFRLSGTSVFYANLDFQLPGISLHVAPECSGIHSTLALLIVSVLAGHTFLRSPWRAALLPLSVLPLALLRNGFRIFVIGELCVHRGPAMINSPIHRHGGPLFFALSLIPLFFLLWVLVRADARRT